MRQSYWMKSAIQLVFLAILTVALVSGGVACPLWITGALDESETHCRLPGNKTSAQCPVSICQLGAAYLARQSEVHHMPNPAAMPVDDAPLDKELTATSFATYPVDTPPPGREGGLFRLTHAFLI